jgi:metal-sulfur cluster biosynthetic enzyme
MPATRATGSYPVKVENGDVLIAVGAASSAAETSPAAPRGAISDTPAVTKPVATEKPVSPPITEPATPVATGEVNEDVLREALKAVVDPELFVNIVDLGLVYNVTVSDRSEDDKKHVVVEMTMTSPACPAGPQLLQGSKDALSRVPGVGSNEVKLVMVPPWTPDRMTEAARDQLGIF